MALARSTDSSSTLRKWGEGRMCGNGRLWKFSSEHFNFLHKARSKIAHWIRMEEELEISGRGDDTKQPFRGQRRNSLHVRKYIKWNKLSMERFKYKWDNIYYDVLSGIQLSD